MFLRENKDVYDESMKIYYEGERKTHLVALAKEGKISKPGCDFDGYVEAIEKGEEWGNDQTLCVMTILMQVEARVVQNLPCPPKQALPRLGKVTINPRDEYVASVVGVIYLLLQSLHYQTLENGAVPTPRVVPPPASEYSEHEGSVHTDKENDVMHDYEKPVRVNGVEYECGAELALGGSQRDGTIVQSVASANGKEWIISTMNAREGGSAFVEIRRMPRIVVKGKGWRRKLPPGAQAGDEEGAGAEDEESWQTEIQQASASGQGWRATPMVAQRLFGLIDKYQDEMELCRGVSDGSTPPC